MRPCARSRSFVLTVISTSWPSAVRRRIGGLLEKFESRPLTAPSSVATAEQHARFRGSPRRSKNRYRDDAGAQQRLVAASTRFWRSSRPRLEPRPGASQPARRRQPAGAPRLHQDRSLSGRPDPRRRGSRERPTNEFPDTGGPFMRDESRTKRRPRARTRCRHHADVGRN